jgi:DNA-binding transcriptional MerR regulator
MRISALAKRTGVTIPTVKFYMRQGLLPSGNPTSVTLAEYGPAHVDRIRLVRALVDVAGLSLTAVRRLLATLEAETVAGPPATEAEASAKSKSKSGSRARSKPAARPGPADRAVAAKALRDAQDALPPEAPPSSLTPARALAAVSALGWQVDSESTALRQLEAALVALDTVGLPPNISTLLAYADAAMRVAEADVESIPNGTAAEVVRHVVVSTAMYEPVLISLRRLAQQHLLS